MSAAEPATATPGRVHARVPLSIVVGLGLVALLVSVPVATALGSTAIPLGEVIDTWQRRLTGQGVTSTSDTIIWNIRAPRILLAAVVGAGLALTGTLIQTLVRNPLADPYLLGVSAGASVGATAVITLGLLAAAGSWALTVGAMIGAMVAATVVFTITVSQGGLTPLRLILTGTVLGSAFSAIASYLVFRSDDPQVAQGVLFWLLGSFSRASWSQLLLPTIAMVVVLVTALRLRAGMDGLLMGAETAHTLGVPVGLLRRTLFLFQAALVGVLVAVAGGIGFVGLIVPHLARLVVGPLHGRLIPAAVVFGAVFMIWVDVAARLLAPPRDIPLSVVTGIVGAPIFLVLLGRKKYRFGGEA